MDDQIDVQSMLNLVGTALDFDSTYIGLERLEIVYLLSLMSLFF